MNYSPALGQNPHSLSPFFPVPSGLFQVLKPWLSQVTSILFWSLSPLYATYLRSHSKMSVMQWTTGTLVIRVPTKKKKCWRQEVLLCRFFRASSGIRNLFPVTFTSFCIEYLQSIEAGHCYVSASSFVQFSFIKLTRLTFRSNFL